MQSAMSVIEEAQERGESADQALDHLNNQVAQSGALAGEADEGSFGYFAAFTAKVAGVTMRQLAYWARTGLVEPTIVLAASDTTAHATSSLCE